MVTNLTDQLKRDEGCRLSAYQDTRGFWTIGYGHKTDGPCAPITQEQAEMVLARDIDAKTKAVYAMLPWVDQLDEIRLAVLINMAFNMGTIGLARFKNTLAAIRRGDYAAAAQGMRSSEWAKELPARVQRLAAQIETGEWQ